MKKLFFFILTLPVVVTLNAQCGTLTFPELFGQSQTAIYCKNSSIFIGVNEPDTTQFYYFSQYSNGVEVSRKGGPLDGSGTTLSVSAFARSAQDAGQYRVTTFNSCGQSSYDSFYVFYGNIDNLSLTAWGANAVSFKWSASGPAPAVNYEYVVTTQSNPDLVPLASISSTTNTSASASGLTNGVTYYIHVRVDGDSVIWHDDFGNEVFVDKTFLDDCSVLPWSTIRFVACSAAATVGTITPANAVVCAGGTIPLTATAGFTTYQWYNENNTVVPSGGTSAVYNAPAAGQYKIYVTKSGSTCQGMIATATVTATSIQTCTFFGSNGNYYAGDTIQLGLSNTVVGQTYKILKDGIEVSSLPGIGNPQQSGAADSVWYKFVITSAAQSGIYTVRITSPYCSSVDVAGSRTINFITGVTICPNSNTSFTFSSPGNNPNFRWQVDPATGIFADISNGPIYSGATTKTLTITNAPSTMYGYRYKCNATGGTPVSSSIRTLRFGQTWLGGSTAFATASNWSCNVAPNGNLDLIIPVTVNSPIITTTNATCHSVLVMPGANLRVNNTGSKLTITGQ